jgi:hypothetical protein
MSTRRKRQTEPVTIRRFVSAMSLIVERGNPHRKRVDKSIKLGVRQRTIDVTIKLGEIDWYVVCPKQHLQGRSPATFTQSLKITGKVLISVHTIYTTLTESLVSQVCACLTQKKEGLPACVNWLTAHVGTFFADPEAVRIERSMKGWSPFRPCPKGMIICR